MNYNDLTELLKLLGFIIGLALCGVLIGAG